ncbi:relaxin 3 [Phyllostomus discolor]|uniref:Relaxin 3 n=1 Tax=Phyllostomus discolor TaxID=89673 RepID=A0A833ZSB9_9CHIR|nr:relaxin 3 [Phyllostomus discolor]
MAKHPMLLLLLAVWVLAVGLWLDAEARKPPIVKKLCGQKFIRAAAQICEHLGSRWSRSAILTQELMGLQGDTIQKLTLKCFPSPRQRRLGGVARLPVAVESLDPESETCGASPRAQ